MFGKKINQMKFLTKKASFQFLNGSFYSLVHKVKKILCRATLANHFSLN